LILASAKEVSVGFVDSERILKEYQATSAANIEFSEFVNTYRDSAAAVKQNIEQLKSELETQKLMLSEDARVKKLDEIGELTESYDRFLEQIFGTGGKIERKNDELMSPLLKEINNAVSKIAQQEGFSIVLDLSNGVFYASHELDLTDMVISELNVEYGPQTLPTGVMKKQIAVFPLREENIEATNADLGELCQNELYKIIHAFSQKFEIVSKNKINREIVKRGFGRDIEDNQAFEIARGLLCHYMIVGSVSKFATKIDYTIALKEVKTNREIGKKSNSLTEEIKLPEFLNNDLRALIEKIE
jgi:Skp family chaperone for outer membrane proteins